MIDPVPVGGGMVNGNVRIGFDARGRVIYVLQWETLGPNRDQPRKEPIPPPSMLTVFKVQGEHAPKVDEEW